MGRAVPQYCETGPCPAILNGFTWSITLALQNDYITLYLEELVESQEASIYHFSKKNYEDTKRRVQHTTHEQNKDKARHV
jgi:hypothetical protein